MSQPEQHEMQIQTKYASGTELWYCPTCGRKFLLDWPPEYKKTVLDPGNELAVHSGGKGGLSMGSTKIGQVINAELPETVRSTIEKILENFDSEDPFFDSTQRDK